MNTRVLIVGAGPIGLACAVSARRRGLDPLVIDAGAIVNSIVHYPIGMNFFTTPELLEIGGHPFPCAGQKPTREEALQYYRGVVRTEDLRIRTFTRLVEAKREDRGIRCLLATTDPGRQVKGKGAPESVLCDRLVLATGYFDHPRMLDVPGEDLPHVSHYYDEGHPSFGRDVVVVGGRNSAIEAALDLFRSGARTTLVYRRTEFRPTVKYWLKPDIENRIKAEEINVRLGAEVERIEPGEVIIRTQAGRDESLPADRVYLLTGFRPDQELFRQVGIRLDPESGRPDIDPDTLETNVPGVYMVGSITRGFKVSEIFIENGRFDGERVFGDLPVLGR